MANIQQEGRGWYIMLNKRDVGGKCSTGGTCVANVQQKDRVWQIFNRRDVGGKYSTGGTLVANVQQEGRVW